MVATGVKHVEVVVTADDAAYEVGTDEWNADHIINGLSGGTITANDPILSLIQTWNGSGVSFQALKLDVTDSASAAGSLLLDLQVGSSSVFKVGKNGETIIGIGTSQTAGGDPIALAIAAPGATHWQSTIDAYGNVGFPSTTWWRKTRGATATAHTILNANDEICVLSFQGSNGTAFQEAVSIDIYVDGSPGGSSMPGRLDIVTNPGTTGSLVRTTWDSQGNVVLGGKTGGIIPLATTATDGFLYLTASNGPPTGVPTTYADRVPLAIDQSNSKLYMYSGGSWQLIGP